MELGDKEIVAIYIYIIYIYIYIHASKRDMLSARIIHHYTCMVYKIVPYAYGIKYAYGTEH